MWFGTEPVQRWCRETIQGSGIPLRQPVDCTCFKPIPKLIIDCKDILQFRIVQICPLGILSWFRHRYSVREPAFTERYLSNAQFIAYCRHQWDGWNCVYKLQISILIPVPQYVATGTNQHRNAVAHVLVFLMPHRPRMFLCDLGLDIHCRLLKKHHEWMLPGFRCCVSSLKRRMCCSRNLNHTCKPTPPMNLDQRWELESIKPAHP